MKLIPGRLRQAREQLLMTQAELAERVGIGTTTINRLETGKQNPRPGTLRKLCLVLELSPNELLDWGDAGEGRSSDWRISTE